jgi:hypothetical protein
MSAYLELRYPESDELPADKISKDYPVDFLCYTPEEFRKLSKQISLVKQAIKEGIEIK